MGCILTGESFSVVRLKLQEILILGPQVVVNLRLAYGNLGLQSVQGTVGDRLTQVVLNEVELANGVLCLALGLGVEDFIPGVLGGLGHLGIDLRSRILQLVDVKILLILPFELHLLPVLELLLNGGFGFLTGKALVICWVCL